MKIADDIMCSLFKGEEPNNAIDLLKFDHRNVSAMFMECLKEEDSARRRELVKEIVEELTLHSIAEEKLVYPILNVEDEFMSQEAYEEHHVMKISLAEAAMLNGTETNFKAKIKVLSELVAHHVSEEESQMLPKVQHSDFDMKELGDKIKAEKEALRAAGIAMPSMTKPEPTKESTAATNKEERVKTTSKSKAATHSIKARKKNESKKTSAIKKQAVKKPANARKAKASASKRRSAA